MATKKYDLVVKVGSYMKNGEEKNRYQNVGVVLEGQHGPYILLNRYFNPAGVPCDTDKDSIIVSLFSPKPQFGDSPASNAPEVDDPTF